VSVRLLFDHRGLLWRVTRRDLAARYAGSGLGIAWAVLYPAMVLGVYALLYIGILKIQLLGLTPVQYVLYMFSGLVPFLACSEAVMSGVGAISANRHVLNSTTFPIALAPAKVVLASQVTMAAGFTLILLTATATGNLHRTMVLLPVLWLAQAMALLGLLWVLSLVNVVLRDLQLLAGAGMLILLLASPIAYSPDMVPPGLALMVRLNPFAWLVVAYQQVTVLGEWPSAGALVAIVGGSALVLVAGGSFFSRVKTVLVDHV
jgi:lipopolysaccharide transport system permease protein